MRSLLVLVINLILMMGAVQARASAIDISSTHAILADEIYHRADGIDLKLDVYAPRANLFSDRLQHPEAKKPVPTVIYFHGGGWMGGSKDVSALRVMPYLEKGWAAVAVQYRLGGDALAPAAVEDTRCAAWWVKRNAEKYGFDSDRIVLTGGSAGGHLSLITGMLTADAGLDSRCPHIVDDSGKADLPELQVAAIVNWFGITDVNDLLQGHNIKTYAVAWLGGQENSEIIAERVSPLTYIHKDLPPILTLHGDKDEIVPYSHALRLHKALERNGTPNQLYTVKEAAHGQFTVEQTRAVFDVIDRFLDKHIAK